MTVTLPLPKVVEMRESMILMLEEQIEKISSCHMEIDRDRLGCDH